MVCGSVRVSRACKVDIHGKGCTLIPYLPPYHKIRNAFGKSTIH